MFFCRRAFDSNCPASSSCTQARASLLVLRLWPWSLGLALEVTLGFYSKAHHAAGPCGKEDSNPPGHLTCAHWALLSGSWLAVLSGVGFYC